MSRTRVRRRRLALVAVIAIGGGVWAGLSAGDGSGGLRPVAEHRYVVRPGDTLWSIAERLDPGSDPRPLVDAIARANDVDPGSVLPGRSLVLPPAS